MLAKLAHAAYFALGIALLGLLFAALPGPNAATAAKPPQPAGPPVAVLVRAGGPLAPAEAAVERAGGHVERELRLTNGFSARVPSGAIAQLDTDPAIALVSPNGSVHFGA